MLIMMHWKMRKVYKDFRLKQLHARTLQHALRGLRTRQAYERVRKNTRVLQHAALVRLARVRAKEVKESPSQFSELMNVPSAALDEMVNEATGEQISLSQSVALSQLFPQLKTAAQFGAKLKALTSQERTALRQKREELASSPESLLGQASSGQVFNIVMANMHWQRSGVQVRVAGRLQKIAEGPKMPRFRLDEGPQGAGWSALVRVKLELIDGRGRVVGEGGRPAGGQGDETPLDTTQPRDVKARTLQAHIRQGTLTLEELNAGPWPLAHGLGGERRQPLGVYPLGLCTCEWASADDGEAELARVRNEERRSSRRRAERPQVSRVGGGHAHHAHAHHAHVHA